MFPTLDKGYLLHQLKWCRDVMNYFLHLVGPHVVEQCFHLRLCWWAPHCLSWGHSYLLPSTGSEHMFCYLVFSMPRLLNYEQRGIFGDQEPTLLESDGDYLACGNDLKEHEQQWQWLTQQYIIHTIIGDCKYTNWAAYYVISRVKALKWCSIQRWINYRDKNISATLWHYEWLWHIREVVNCVIDFPDRSGLYWIKLTKNGDIVGSSFSSCNVSWSKISSSTKPFSQKVVYHYTILIMAYLLLQLVVIFCS